MADTSDTRRVVVAQFAGTHGVRGDFKLRSFTEDPQAVFGYGPLQSANGKSINPHVLREVKPGVFLCRDEKLTSPEACAELKGELFSVPRETLPDTDEDDFYIEDLIGLEARDEAGDSLGRVKAVPNYGAGDIVEIKGKGGLVLVPFTRDDVPVVALADGYIVVVPPSDEGAEPESD